MTSWQLEASVKLPVGKIVREGLCDRQGQTYYSYVLDQTGRLSKSPGPGGEIHRQGMTEPIHQTTSLVNLLL